MVVYIRLMLFCGLVFAVSDPILLTGTHDAHFDWLSWNLGICANLADLGAQQVFMASAGLAYRHPILEGFGMPRRQSNVSYTSLPLLDHPIAPCSPFHITSIPDTTCFNQALMVSIN